MYSTCLFCHTNLGANESIEHFPIGRRLAFDATKGRLWVVCRKCERWNLTPLEERWEAIEECERLFTSTRMRTSTDNIGLARLNEGLELIRIGAPQRPEMAAWRYGDQFGRRRRRHFILAGTGAVTAVGLMVLGPVTGLFAGGGWTMYNLVSSAHSLYTARKVRARLNLPGRDAPVPIRLKHLQNAAIIRGEQSWALRVPYDLPSKDRPPGDSFWKYENPAKHALRIQGTAVLEGDEALRMAGKLLPQINAAGAKKTQVQSAVKLIEEVPDPRDLFARFGGAGHVGSRRRLTSGVTGHVLSAMTTEVRLALEMAAHEDAERQAMAGELALLEAAWRQAEEIASIADDMFVDDERRKIDEMKKR